MMRLENILSVESIRRNPASDGQAAIAGERGFGASQIW